GVAELGDDCVELSGVDVGEDESGAAIGSGDGCGAADAAGGACYEAMPVGERGHGGREAELHARSVTDGANFRGPGTSLRMEALDELAHSLRRRLVERARDGGTEPGGVEAQAARLVESEAAALDPETREVLTARIVRLATGLGPL